MKSRVAFFCLIVATGLLLAHPLAAETTGQKEKACSELAGLGVVGEMEHITFTEQKLFLKARIDTGAETSSLGIDSSHPFERDGIKWLKFSVQNPGSEKLAEFEKPLERTALIKRHGAEAIERPVVKLKISLANVEMEREFTLADRSKFKFPVLIGRNVLKGKYLVDVNRKYSTSKSEEAEE